MTAQYEDAQRLLPLLAKASTEHQYLTYRTAAQALGRPANHSRAVAQVCDLLDAAAALANVPLLALITVLDAKNRINPKAWTGKEVEPGIRDAIISRSCKHTFTKADFDAIGKALEELKGKSNRAAWEYLRTLMPSPERRLQIAGSGTPGFPDAIDDIGADAPAYLPYSGRRYVRDPKVREVVRSRANGRCEYCGEIGFECLDGSRYLECHHILALADEGADRPGNVIAVCSAHHREAHFGRHRAAIEKVMIEKVEIAEQQRLEQRASLPALRLGDEPNH